MISYLRERVVIIVLFAALAGLTFGLQSAHTGFWTSLHGWTSVHGLALMTHATPENGFVAYTQAIRQADGSLDYEYFDRYPPLFAASGRLLLNITDDLPTEVTLMRQVMNVIYLSILFMAYRLARFTVRSRPLAFAAAVLAGSSFHMLYYKDMIHYDTPAILGLLTMAYIVGRYHAGTARGWQVVAVALLTISFGRGYAIVFLLAAWWLIEAIDSLRGDGSVTARVRRVLYHTSTVTLVAGVIWSAGWIAYNTAMEARTRGVPIAETSIVDSALRQIPFLDPTSELSPLTEGQERSLTGWGRFVVTQTERIGLWAVPLQIAGDMRWRYYPLQDAFEVNAWRLVLAISVIVIAVWGLVRTKPIYRKSYLLAAIGGLLWLYLMFSLSTAHIYVTMYAYGIILIAYISLIRLLDEQRWAGIVVAIFAIGLYSGSAYQARALQDDEMTEARFFTEDFNRIRASVEGDWATIYFTPDFGRGTCIIRQDICYAPGYYLGDKRAVTVDTKVPADYALSPNPFYTPKRFLNSEESVSLYLPLHPQNTHVYLYDLSMPIERTAPSSATANTIFGEEIGLHSWMVNGEIVVEPCHDIWIESWWTATVPPEANYTMQITMVNEDGRAITQAGGQLGSVPPQIWELERFTFDTRQITVPCDTLSGSYPLILGIFNPITQTPLSASSADGTLLGNQIYLTNVVVP